MKKGQSLTYLFFYYSEKASCSTNAVFQMKHLFSMPKVFSSQDISILRINLSNFFRHSLNQSSFIWCVRWTWLRWSYCITNCFYFAVGFIRRVQATVCADVWTLWTTEVRQYNRPCIEATTSHQYHFWLGTPSISSCLDLPGNFYISFGFIFIWHNNCIFIWTLFMDLEMVGNFDV